MAPDDGGDSGGPVQSGAVRVTTWCWHVSWTLQEPQIEGPEHQDNSDVYQ
jgi:hypothetical protein